MKRAEGARGQREENPSFGFAGERTPKSVAASESAEDCRHTQKMVGRLREGRGLHEAGTVGWGYILLTNPRRLALRASARRSR